MLNTKKAHSLMSQPYLAIITSNLYIFCCYFLTTKGQHRDHNYLDILVYIMSKNLYIHKIYKAELYKNQKFSEHADNRPKLIEVQLKLVLMAV